MMNWLDSHCHINDAAFKEDLNEVLERMVEADVRKAMIISSYIPDFEYALKISHPEIEFKRSLGIYPGDVDDVDEKLFEEYAKLYESEECQAIGEIGLDYYWNKENRDRQLEIFERQLALAEKLQKPVIIHSRNAIQDTYDLMKKYRNTGVMHCYSDSAEMAKEFVKLGYYVSIAGPVTWKNAKEPLRVIRNVPVDRLLIETDCPYLTPSPNRGKRNEPSYVVYTGRKICEELGIDEEEFRKQLNENYER
ncbi:MAG: TatD family hydrolase, partial [Erysipelotrichaceae bacterium]|nr:TatD family hydrolase [Erysipelotrichaceae bacterium]